MTRPQMSGRRLLMAAGALSLTLPIHGLAAQGPGLFDAFAARKESPTDPLFAGLGLTGYSGVFGIRVSGALNFNNGNSSPQTQGYGTYYRCDRFGGCRCIRIFGTMAARAVRTAKP